MENNNRCFIYLWDKLVGEMILVRDTIYFKYDVDFNIEVSPLSLPISQSQYSFKKLDFQHSIAGVFSDSLPDSFGMKILDRYFEKNHKRFKPNIIDKLLFVGDVSLGALSYRPSLDSIKNENIAIDLKNAKTHKKNILEKNSYSSIREAIDMYKSFSPAGGAKQKMIVNYDETNKLFFVGKEDKRFSSLIVKIDESEKPNYGAEGIGEYIYSKVAKSCGINIPKTYLFKDDDNFIHFGIKRFDSSSDGKRFHTHTLAGLLHMEKSTRIDYIELIKIAKEYLFIPDEDIVELYRRMVFNYIYNNNDDHLKNYTFLMDEQGNWRVSPAYDLTYNNSYGQSIMILNINNKTSDEVCYEDFKYIAKIFKIDNFNEIIEIVKESKKLFVKLLDEMMGENLKYDKLQLLDTRTI